MTIKKILVSLGSLYLLSCVNSSFSKIDVEFITNEVPLYKLEKLKFRLKANFDSPELSFSDGNTTIETPSDKKILIEQLYIENKDTLNYKYNLLSYGFTREAERSIPGALIPYSIAEIINKNTKTSFPLLGGSIIHMACTNILENNRIVITAINENTFQVKTVVAIKRDEVTHPAVIINNSPADKL